MYNVCVCTKMKRWQRRRHRTSAFFICCCFLFHDSAACEAIYRLNSSSLPTEKEEAM